MCEREPECVEDLSSSGRNVPIEEKGGASSIAPTRGWPRYDYQADQGEPATSRLETEFTKEVALEEEKGILLELLHNVIN